MPSSLKSELANLKPSDREAFLASLTDDEADRLWHDWELHARPNQVLPLGDWMVWLILSGRGFGKTRCGVEAVKSWSKTSKRVNLAGATADDVRQIMIEGESGILPHCARSERPLYIPSQRKLVWPSGCVSLLLYGTEPDRARGKQSEKLWADEVASWAYPETWDQLMFGLRLGDNPQAIVTTTPRPIPIIKELVAAKSTKLTRGSTYDNKDNLALKFYTQVITKYEGTRLGRQELNAEILDDNPSALFTLANIEQHRINKVPENMARVVVGVDPAATSGEDADDTGIITASRDNQNPPHFYVYDDDTCHEKPLGWAQRAVGAYKRHKADRIIGETNNGGEMVEATIRSVDANVAYRSVHASRGKVVRAEPVSALYEQGRVHHVGVLAKLEDEITQFDPSTYEPGKSPSPNRMDALVWAITELSENVDGLVGYYAEKQAAQQKEKDEFEAKRDERKKMTLPKDIRSWSPEIRLIAISISAEGVTKDRWHSGFAAELEDWIDLCEKDDTPVRLRFAEKEYERLQKKFGRAKENS